MFRRHLVAVLLIAVGPLLVTGCQSSRLGLLDQEVKSVPRSSSSVRPPYTRVPAQQSNTGQAASSQPRETEQASLPPRERLQLDPGVVRVGLLLPRSGVNAKWGRELHDAAQLAFFDFSGPGFQLLPYDTKGTPEGAADAADEALSAGASIIVGPLLASSVQAVAPMARSAGVNVLAFSNNRAALADNVYLMGFMPEAEIKRVVSYAAKRGMTEFAVLGPDNEYGRTVLAAAREAAEAGGGEITRVALYDPYTSDFNQIIRNLGDYDERHEELLKQRKELEEREDEIAVAALKRLENLQTVGSPAFNALLIAEGGKRLQTIAALLPYYDIDPSQVRMLGTGQWDVPGIGTEPALVGGWYAAPQPEARGNFVTHFKNTYGREPSRLATLAYDAVALTAVLARKEREDKFSGELLTTPSGFAGRDGIFRFSADGASERGLAVMEIRGRQTRVVSPSPDRFQ